MTKGSEETLKPCPFCGGEAHTYKNNLWHVGCEHAYNNCVTMSAFVTEAEAIEAWNARASELVSETCELKQASWDDDQCTWGCICSACDAHFEHETGIGYNYCPNCGRKVEQ